MTTRDYRSKRRVCSECPAVITDNNTSGRCRDCAIRRRKASTPVRRDITPTGYVVVHNLRDNPNTDARGRCYEHVLVMSEILGRPLMRGESVHHINGIRSDNRPENLELWGRPQPMGVRVADQVKWAKEILSIYEPESLRGV